MAEETRSSSPLLIAAAWAVVVIPACWGLNYTVQNAAKIFTQPAATVAPSVVPSGIPSGNPLPPK